MDNKKKQQVLCSQKGCCHLAAYSYRWPGMRGTGYACKIHAEVLMKLARKAGWTVHMRRLFRQLPHPEIKVWGVN